MYRLNKNVKEKGLYFRTIFFLTSGIYSAIINGRALDMVLNENEGIC